MLSWAGEGASLTIPYKVGFNQAKNDYLVLRSDVADACKKFPGSSSDILTPNGECTRGYIDGPAALTNNTQQVVPPTGVTAYNCRIPRDRVYSYNHGEVKLKLSEEEVHKFKVSQPYKAVGGYTDYYT